MECLWSACGLVSVSIDLCLGFALTLRSELSLEFEPVAAFDLKLMSELEPAFGQECVIPSQWGCLEIRH